jgi:hypothetical protein
VVRACLLIAFWVLVASGCGKPTLNIFNPDLGILGHWPLDQPGAGDIQPDTSGFGHHGTPSVSPPVPTRDVPAVHFDNPHSLSFNGMDQWVDLGNPALLDTGGPLTLAAWIRSGDNGGGAHDILAHGYHNAPDVEIALRIIDGLYSFVFWDGTDHGATSPVPPADIGTWVHRGGVFDGGAYHLYRNGALVASIADSTRATSVPAPWAIGARAPASPGDGGTGWAARDRLFLGGVDDVRIYGRALSAGEIDALYRR